MFSMFMKKVLEDKVSFDNEYVVTLVIYVVNLFEKSLSGRELVKSKLLRTKKKQPADPMAYAGDFFTDETLKNTVQGMLQANTGFSISAPEKSDSKTE